MTKKQGRFCCNVQVKIHKEKDIILRILGWLQLVPNSSSVLPSSVWFSTLCLWKIESRCMKLVSFRRQTVRRGSRTNHNSRDLTRLVSLFLFWTIPSDALRENISSNWYLLVKRASVAKKHRNINVPALALFPKIYSAPPFLQLWRWFELITGAWQCSC